MNQTGGGPAAKDLTLLEHRVLNLIGSVVVSGHPNTPTSNVSFEDIIIDSEMEHNYCHLEEPEVIVNHFDNLENRFVPTSQHNEEKGSITQLESNSPHFIIEESQSDPIKHANKENMRKSSPSSKGDKGKTAQKRFVKTRRLENSLRATNTLAEQTEVKLELKKKYYKRKLELLEDCNQVNKSIAVALNKIAEALL